MQAYEGYIVVNPQKEGRDGREQRGLWVLAIFIFWFLKIKGLKMNMTKC
jgi:hypothetical protein